MALASSCASSFLTSSTRNQKCSRDSAVYWACAVKKVYVFLLLLLLVCFVLGGQSEKKNGQANRTSSTIWTSSTTYACHACLIGIVECTHVHYVEHYTNQHISYLVAILFGSGTASFKDLGNSCTGELHTPKSRFLVDDHLQKREFHKPNGAQSFILLIIQHLQPFT